MVKKLTITLLILLMIAGLTGYTLFRYRENMRKQRQAAKAPETQVTIIEGRNNNDIANLLAQKNLLSNADFLAAEKRFNTSSYPILASKPKTADLEGFLFPDTYRIAKYPGESTTTLATVIVKKMLDNFSAKFTDDMVQAAAANHMSVYDIVTLASIIEKETGRNAVTEADKAQLQDERKTVAGIFYNRLNAGQPLQSDATVNYVTGKDTPTASTEDTQIDSPYNTYKYKGLPPGPIANPSLSSLLAAVYPTSTRYFYFLHVQPSGQIIYSVTYEEHLKNKQKYLK